MSGRYRIALAGNPNCGKTTLFNALTGTRQHVGNYAGVTVERKTGSFQAGELEITAVDLPGIYSLSSSSPEEKVAFQELLDEPVDLIVNVVDSANLQRNLYLTTQLAELGIPYILVFNMIDDARRNGFAFDIPKIQQFFGTVVVETVGTSATGLEQLRETIAEVLTGKKALGVPRFRYSKIVDEAIQEVVGLLEPLEIPEASRLPRRYLAIKLIEGDETVGRMKSLQGLKGRLETMRTNLVARTGLPSDTLMADTRYGMIAGACREAISIDAHSRRQLSDKIDKFVTSPFLGLPIFLLIMFLVFTFTFTCGDPLCELVEILFDKIRAGVGNVWPAERLTFLHDLVLEGIIPGVGGVLTFLPNILLLFLAIAFLEGTGYMNRAAFVMDGFMHMFGLHGKSFIPMLLGFGCTVPAVLATRTIESRRDRLTTILILPLMSCGARFPIYSLFIPAFFPARMQPLVLFLIYLIGVALALILARVLKSTLFKGDDEVFVMELPPYRMPTLKGICIDIGERAVMYLHKAGTVILAASVILFIINTYPRTEGLDSAKRERLAALEAQLTAAEQPAGAEKTAERIAQERERDKLLGERDINRTRATLGGHIGSWLSRVLSLAGFVDRTGEPDWKASSATVGAFAAKELFVSQLSILYSAEHRGDGENARLQDQLRDHYTPLSGFCMMLFCLIAMPCIGTVAVVWRETASLKLTLLQLAGLTLIAYVAATVVYQTGRFLAIGMG